MGKKIKTYTQPKNKKDKDNIRKAMSNAILQEKQIKQMEKEAKDNRLLKDFYVGRYNDSNLYYYIRGLQVLKMVANGGLTTYEFYLNANKNKTKKNIAKEMAVILTKSIMNISIDIINEKLTNKYEQARNINNFEQMCEFIAEGRNVITEEREIDGVKIQQAVSVKDVYGRLRDFAMSMNLREEATFNLYSELGKDSIAFLGVMTKLAKENKKDAISMGALTALCNIGKTVNTIKHNKTLDELYNERGELREDEENKKRALLETKPTNKHDLEVAKGNAINANKKLIESDYKIEIQRTKSGYKSDAILAAMTGAIVFSEMQKYKGQLDASTVSKITLNVMNKKRILELYSNCARPLKDKETWDREYRNNLEKVLDMAKQIEEKSDQLTTPKVKINSIEFKDFKGEFYKTQIEGRAIPECVINIPNMKAEVGQTILITGNSGSGKSTLLKFLRDGDIENKGQIIINGTDRVDKLGLDIVSMCEAKMNLNSFNALQDVTGKTRQKDLSKEEFLRLKEIFSDLGLMQEQKSDFLNKCEYKTYEQFSTGQQKRLELAKVLFSINDNSQVVLLDETVSNVQRELGEGAFRLIHKYTKKGTPKIVIMVSHDIETASKYADKRYHINENQTVEEIPLRKQEIDFKEDI